MLSHWERRSLLRNFACLQAEQLLRDSLRDSTASQLLAILTREHGIGHRSSFYTEALRDLGAIAQQWVMTPDTMHQRCNCLGSSPQWHSVSGMSSSSTTRPGHDDSRPSASSTSSDIHTHGDCQVLSAASEVDS